MKSKTLLKLDSIKVSFSVEKLFQSIQTVLSWHSLVASHWYYYENHLTKWPDAW